MIYQKLHIISGIPLPLTTVMILLLDLGIDLAPTISVTHTGREVDIMDRKPRDPNKNHSMNGFFFVNLFVFFGKM